MDKELLMDTNRTWCVIDIIKETHIIPQVVEVVNNIEDKGLRKSAILKIQNIISNIVNELKGRLFLTNIEDFDTIHDNIVKYIDVNKYLNLNISI